MIPTWAERCEKFENGEIVTNAKIQQAMQEEIDELRKIVEGTIGQAFYEDDYHKAKAEIEALKKSFDVLRSAYISVSGGLEVSLELNKAQALRNGGDK